MAGIPEAKRTYFIVVTFVKAKSKKEKGKQWLRSHPSLPFLIQQDHIFSNRMMMAVPQKDQDHKLMLFSTCFSYLKNTAEMVASKMETGGFLQQVIYASCCFAG